MGDTAATLGNTINPTVTPPATVTATPTGTVTPGTPPVSICLAAGDEVLLVQLAGDSTTSYNSGSYEFLRVASVNGTTVNFSTSKTKWYGYGWRNDLNIGTGTGQIRVMLMRVPNYNNVTLSGSNAKLTANSFDGNKYGVVVFRVFGQLTGSGVITATGLGGGGGYAKGGDAVVGRSGGGGGFGTNGGTATSDGSGGSGGIAFGDITLQKIYLGSAGGSTSGYETQGTCGGGNGPIISCTIWHPGPVAEVAVVS